MHMYLAVLLKTPPKSFLNQILTVHCILISEVKREYVENMCHFTCTYFPGASLDVPQEGYQFFWTRVVRIWQFLAFAPKSSVPTFSKKNIFQKHVHRWISLKLRSCTFLCLNTIHCTLFQSGCLDIKQSSFKKCNDWTKSKF